jgi:hypothetical protein
VRAGLALAQDHLPQLPQKVATTVQGLTLVADTVDTCYTGYGLVQLFQSADPNKKDKKKGAMVAMAFAAVGAFSIQQVGSYWASQINLNTLVKETSFTASWTKPRFNTIICVLLATRIILNVGRACLSSKPQWTSLMAASQVATLFKTSQIHGLELTRVDQNPFETMQYTIEEGGPLEAFQNAAKELKVIFNLRVTHFDPSALKQAVQSVHNYSNEMFTGSTWSRFWIEKLGNHTTQTNYSDRLSMDNFQTSPSWWKISPFRQLAKFHRLTAACEAGYSVTLNPAASKPSVLSSVIAKILHVDTALCCPLPAYPWTYFSWWRNRYPLVQQSTLTAVNFLKK